eukprot:CAMPEP_0202685658 /NCGR_PEP_ID=MMETSP1385-20130828/1482_1 /ASSEMBLY_ACC=CAM_ASM_000861 /TAXON_ID=933848 /ORGANISM="Elphidium margaritaceum" /LENGTH=69 /DNA_ID=CAMNT_0049340077 /DNA_START=63 /DNA_END=268 /DNA_ORIENTATION=-
MTDKENVSPTGVDSTLYTKQKIYDDIKELAEGGSIDFAKHGKKTIRATLEQHYSLDEKTLRKYAPFDGA